MVLVEQEEVTPEILLAQVNSKYLHKLIKTKVMVSKVGEIGAEIYGKSWKCSRCNDVHETTLSEDKYKCKECGGWSVFRSELKRDFKEIEVEELLVNMDRQPERMRVRIVGKLLLTKKIEFIQPGDVIDLIGSVEEEKTKTKLDRIILSFYVLASSIQEREIDDEDELLTLEDIEKIKEISKDNPIEKLRDSIAPNIYDYEKIKTALLLQMVRGPESIENTRPTIHILMCGTASSGKSKLAQAIHQRMPKSIYGSGENMSKAGLVSSMEKDELSGRWGIRAGTLCRANKSIVVIDELDKLNKDDRDGLHTPMEMRKILVDKAGIHCEMSADCSILGCCNPKNGKFDLTRMESIQSQINLPEPLMTRFDLIYIMQDKIDKERDEKILRSLINYKKVICPVNEKLFKKYIKYASKIEPIFDEEVGDTFVQIISNLRQSYSKMENKGDKTAITFRQGGALIRLATAAAKIRLSTKVELCDLKLAEDLMLDALESAGFGRDFNSIEYAALYGGTTSKKIAFNDMIKNEIQLQIISGNKSEDGIKKIFTDKKISEKDYLKVFNQLRQDGTIIGHYNDLKWVR